MGPILVLVDSFPFSYIYSIKIFIMKGQNMGTAYWLAWAHLCQGRALRKIFDYYNSDGERAWLSPVSALVRLGFEQKTLERFANAKASVTPQNLVEKMESFGIRFVVLNEPDYPTVLKQIPDAPVLLFYQGILPAEQELLLAVVGTRGVSAYGASVTLTITRELARHGLTIVSGLMRGVDALAHEAALDVGGRTIGVPGTGLLPTDIYPREHAKLARRIVESGGAMISEYPPGTGPELYRFPERNRIVAGLSRGTLVIEAPQKSGALITARLALDYNREVMATPGNINSKNSVGANNLLKQGAHLIQHADDVLEKLGLEIKKDVDIDRALTQDETLILEKLCGEPMHVDVIQEQIKLASGPFGAALTLLELKGIVKDMGGKRYIKLI